MNDKCADCGTSKPEMFNCDEGGERIDGMLCYGCWKGKHPVMQRTEVHTNPIVIIWLVFLSWILIFSMYKLWSYAL